jgi:octaprenyl-diphosphate synthase
LSHPPSPSQPLDLIRADMREVDQVIQRRLTSDVPLVREVAQYIISAGGKRLRPALLLLVSGALSSRANSAQPGGGGRVHPHRHPAARRCGRRIHPARGAGPPPTRRFGNAASVLVGDFLYSRAFQMMVDVSDMRVMQVLSDATNVIAEGEVLQLMNMHDASIDEPPTCG